LSCYDRRLHILFGRKKQSHALSRVCQEFVSGIWSALSTQLAGLKPGTDLRCLSIGVRTGQRYPFQTYLPQGQGTVSAGCFFSKGFLQTGQFFCHIITPGYSSGPALENAKLARATCAGTVKFQVSLCVRGRGD